MATTPRAGYRRASVSVPGDNKPSVVQAVEQRVRALVRDATRGKVALAYVENDAYGTACVLEHTACEPENRAAIERAAKEQLHDAPWHLAEETRELPVAGTGLPVSLRVPRRTLVVHRRPMKEPPRPHWKTNLLYATLAGLWAALAYLLYWLVVVVPHTAAIAMG